MKKLILGLLVIPVAVCLGESSGNSGNSNAKFKNLLEETTVYVPTLAVESITLNLKAENSYTIEEIVTKCNSGSGSVSLQIDAVNVTGCSTISVTGTATEYACTALNTLNKDSKLDLTVHSESACSGFSAGVVLRRIS